jgi:hypothetical protein
MQFHYVRADNVRKTIGYDESRGKTATDPTIPSSFFVSPATLDLGSLDSCREFVNSTRVLGSPCFELFAAGRQCVSRKLKLSGNYPTAITRTKEDFAFLQGPGLMFVDCDMKIAESQFRPLVELGLSPDVLRLEYFSSSSFLYRNSQWVTQASGRHIMLAVENAADIPQMGEWLYLRSWLSGNGYVHITPNGRALDRSYVDQAVWQPERLVFGRPTLIDGLAQALYEPEVSGHRLLTLADLALTFDQEHQARAMIAEARHRAMSSPETLAKLQAFAQTNRYDGEPLSEAVIRNGTMAQRGLLPPYMRLNTQFGTFSVRDIYANFERFYETSLADPVEPTYGNGDTRIAMFVYLYGDKRGLYSHAHGGQSWLLMPATVEDDPLSHINEDPYLDIEEIVRM